ncbi:Biopolymer transport protein ExbD/TolR [Isosphaera pallida ATCC 43644]|jgi:biopolymer transport protein ExbD|uniref:Biopolymer transport protein ExbD/TolR n=1 Tax=Isosphaera pallida (strain ATCC 43644 / DSM 9630 / IS1B) TaxID=575540 RepID=E8R3X9_ISOPI|nr:biopolymer transporter ExbD [Isosphaera pallida]ADV63709.1 Biopolymer transport protein ExbD/TolR [Isosphaera pallida ATCC 43644]
MMLKRGEALTADDTHIDMTPMVDVVFQLMTFMLFSMQATGGEKVNVPPARHGGVLDQNQVVVITVAPPRPGAEARVVLGDGLFDENGQPRPEVSAEGIKKAVEQAKREQRSRVVIQGDGEASYGEVMRVASQVAEVEGVSVHIGVQEPKGSSR